MAITYPPYPSIRIDGAVFKKPADIKWYERDTLGVLNAIKKVDTGQAVLDYIQNVKAGRTVTIKPYNWAYIKKTFPKNQVQNIWNATSVPADGTLSEDAGQSVLTEVITGPARGTSTEVYFTKWVINNPKYRKIAGIPKGGAGSLPDEILLH